MNAITHLSSTATSNTALAAALSAVGIPLAEKPFVRVVGDGIRGERVVWFFDPQSPCGKYRSTELIAAWSDNAWHLANPATTTPWNMEGLTSLGAATGQKLYCRFSFALPSRRCAHFDVAMAALWSRDKLSFFSVLIMAMEGLI